MKKEYCQCCGQPIMKHKHYFNKSLADILLNVSNKYGSNTPFHLQKGLSLTKNQYNNFQKLQYWGLVEKCFVSGQRQSGYWKLTEDVMGILNGERIPSYVSTFNNKVVEVSAETTTLNEAIGYYDIPETWAKRSEVAFETQLNLI